MRSTGRKAGSGGIQGNAGRAPPAPPCPRCGTGSLRFDRDLPRRSATGQAGRLVYLRCTSPGCDFELQAEAGARTY